MNFLNYSRDAFIYEKIKKYRNIDLTYQFFEAIDEPLRIEFEKKTGIKHKYGKTCISFGYYDDFKFTKGLISTIDARIIIKEESNKVLVCWKSKSGKIYDIGDTEFEKDDIIVWYEGLDPLLYHKQLNTTEELPFKLPKLNFEIEIKSIQMDIELMVFFDKSLMKYNEIEEKINFCCNNWNLNTEKEDAIKITNDKKWFESKGVVHSYRLILQNENSCNFKIDLGSADVIVIKKIILSLKNLEGITKVTIE